MAVELVFVEAIMATEGIQQGLMKWLRPSLKAYYSFGWRMSSLFS